MNFLKKFFASFLIGLLVSANFAHAAINGGGISGAVNFVEDTSGTELWTTNPNITGICDSTGASCTTMGTSGDVIGPASAVDENLSLFNGTTGKLIKDSGVNKAEMFNILSSGLTSLGGELSINADTTKFDISDANGIVVDSYTNPANPVITPVTLTGLTAITPTFLLTGPTSYISINSAGAVEQQATLYSKEDLRNRIPIGVAFHPNLTNISAVIKFAKPVINLQDQIGDISTAIGAINVSGNDFSANGANLKLDKSAGEVYTLGGNYYTDLQNPSFITTGLVTPVTFSYTYEDGASGFTTEAGVTDITPARYDDLSGTPATVESYQWTVQRIYFETGGTGVIHLGTDVYNNKDAAIAAIDTEVYNENPLLSGFIRRYALIVRGDATALNDSDTAVFREYNKDGSVILGTGASEGVTNLFNLANGSVVDQITTSIASNGVTVTFSIERDGGGDLVVQFGGENFSFDSSPAATVNLTAGSDIAPTMNYVYFTRTGTTVNLLANTTGFPATEHAPLGEVYVQSAASVQTDGPYDHHQWSNELGNGQGHLDHLNFWIRRQNATWLDGVAPTTSITVNAGAIDNVYFSSASGNMLQLHKHVVPAKDMAVSDPAWVVNDSTTVFDRITDLSTIDTDSTGATLRTNNTYYSLVVWVNQTQNTSDTKYFVNAPSGSYANSVDAIDDNSRYSNYTIPPEFKGTGFLVARVILRYQTAASGTITEVQTENLRGLVPSTAAGGAGSVASSEFADNVFRVQAVGDNTSELAFDISGVTTATTRTLTIPDVSGVAAVSTMTDDFLFNGNVGIGAGAATPGTGLDVSYSDPTMILGSVQASTARTDATNKLSRIVQVHYTNAEQNISLIGGNATSTANDIYIGGNTGNLNAATSIEFYTGANNTTLGGTERMTIDSSGNVGIGTTPVTPLTVDGDIRMNSLESFLEFYNGGTRTGGIGLTTGDANDISMILQDSTGGDGFRVANSGNTTLFKVESGGKVFTGTAGTTNMASGDFLVNGGSLVLKEITTPTADTNFGKIYTKTDDELYFQNGAGSETQISNQGGGSSPAVKFSSSYEATGRHTSTLVSGGTVTFGLQGADVNTSGTATSSALVKTEIGSSTAINIMDGSPKFSTIVSRSAFSATAGSAYMGVGTVPVDGSSHTFTEDHFGFKLTESAGTVSLYATQADGTTETASAALTTVVSADVLELVAEKNGTTNIAYYWRKNGGTLSAATTLSANLPRAAHADNALNVSTSNHGAAALARVIVSSVSYER